MGKFYSKEEIKFLRENAEKFGAVVCAEKLKRPLQGVMSKINRLGLFLTKECKAKTEEVESLKFVSSFVTLDLDFNTSKYPKELAYFLGFVWADGYIHNGEIRIEIAEEDGENLKPIFMKLASFSIYKRKRDGRKPQITFYYKDNSVCDTIQKLGKYPNSIESHKKIFEYIPKPYHIWFLRGLIDGDGCFYIHDYGNTILRQFSIAASIDFDWSFLITYMESLGIYCQVNKAESSAGKSSHIRCTDSKSIKQFINLLYKDNDKIYLDRKYNKAILL